MLLFFSKNKMKKAVSWYNGKRNFKINTLINNSFNVRKTIEKGDRSMRSVLITGASRGIGLSIARRFAGSGDLVFACYSGKSKNGEPAPQQAEAERELLTASGCIPLLCDVASEEEVKAMFAAIFSRTDHLDVLVNNAGISHIGLLQDMTADEWDRVLNVNLRGVFLTCREALPGMIRRQSGAIVNVSSMWGSKGASCEVAYSASKGGLNAFTKALAKETGPSGIRVNAVACGVIETAMNAFLTEEDRRDLADSIALGRFGDPSEAADLVFYLAGPESSYLTGEIIALDGGI